MASLAQNINSQNDMFLDMLRGIIRDEVYNILAEEREMMIQENQPKHFSLKEAAKYLKIKPQTLRMWNMEHRIPFYKVGRNCFYKKSELDDYLFSKTRVSSEEEIECDAITRQVLKRLDRRR